jgi:hypothetical protein
MLSPILCVHFSTSICAAFGHRESGSKTESNSQQLNDDEDEGDNLKEGWIEMRKSSKEEH